MFPRCILGSRCPGERDLGLQRGVGCRRKDDLPTRLTCAGGEVQTCTSTDSNGLCNAVVYRYAGNEYACNGCGDCTQASADVAAACEGEIAGDDASPVNPHLPGSDAGTDGNSGTRQCTAPVSCVNGATYSVCETTLLGVCSGTSYAFSDGTSFACHSCVDCASAELSAQARCNSLPEAGVDASGDSGGSGDAGTCGTAPILHPEAQAGVYCPFLSTSAKNCLANQQCCEPPAGTGSASTRQSLGTTCPAPTRGLAVRRLHRLRHKRGRARLLRSRSRSGGRHLWFLPGHLVPRVALRLQLRGGRSGRLRSLLSMHQRDLHSLQDPRPQRRRLPLDR